MSKRSLASGFLVFASLAAAPSAFAGADPCPYQWNQNMHIGSVGADVLKLQQFLNQNGEALALNGPGSPGNESDSFGTRTAKAVAAFQDTYASTVLAPAGLSSGTGFVGSLTRAKLNDLCSAETTASTSATAAIAQNSLTVSTGQQPSQTIVPAGAGGVPFTSFTLTAGDRDVTVHDVMVERTGPGEDGAFSDVTLNDESGAQVGNTEYFNSNHIAAFDQPFVVPAGTSETYTISADMAGDLSQFDGQMPVLQIDSIDASAPVSGSFPIQGTAQTLNASLVIGGAYASLSPFDPGGPTDRYVNETGVIFSGIRISADSQEDLTLSSIAWDQTGTAGPEDIANVATVVDGVSYSATSNGNSYTSTFSPAIIIPKGQSIDAYVQGDLTATGANRTVEFDIDDSSDIALSGDTYGFGVGIAPESDTAQSGNSVFLTSDGTPEGDEGASFFAGSVATINPGTAVYIGR